MKVEQIGGYIPPTVSKVYCEGHVTEVIAKYHEQYGYKDPNKCTRFARYTLDGKKLCKLHAGAEALDYLIKAGDK